MLEGLLIGGFVLAILFLIFRSKLAKMRLFQASLFKQMLVIFGSPVESVNSIKFDETGEVGIVAMPLNTGFLIELSKQRAWRMVHLSLGKIVGTEGSYLPIGTRSYMPLDPWNRMPEETKKKIGKKSRVNEEKEEELGELDSLARREHGKAVRNLRDSRSKREAASMFKTVMIVSGIIIILVVAGKMIWK